MLVLCAISTVGWGLTTALIIIMGYGISYDTHFGFFDGLLTEVPLAVGLWAAITIGWLFCIVRCFL